MNKKILIIIIILLLVLIGGIFLFFNKPEVTYKTQINNELKEEQILNLIKYSTMDLADYTNKDSNIITANQKVKFALSYLTVAKGNDIEYIEDEYIAKVSKNLIEQTVEYIFAAKVDYSNLTYNVDDNYIYIPRNMTGGDSQIYKYKSKEYDEAQNTYTVLIDVLDVGASRYSKLQPSEVLDYDESDVIFTIVFKYRQLEDRKVLLAYKLIQNW